MNDLLKPDKDGDLSYKTYSQGGCKLFRFKYLSGSGHKEPMGRGTGNVSEPPKKHQRWKYPFPDSIHETMLQDVCDHVK